MTNLDRPGIFKARPVQWKVKTFEGKASVAIAIEFVVTAQLDGGDWVDWSGYAPHHVWGDFFVVKKDGTSNVATVQQLAVSLGWNGSLRQINSTAPPQDEVQITVKDEVYNGKTYYKASWINPGDYVPNGGGADDAEVDQLEARFGSLLRAAAGSKRPAAPKAQPPAKAAETAAPPAARQDQRDAGQDYGQIPF